MLAPIIFVQPIILVLTQSLQIETVTEIRDIIQLFMSNSCIFNPVFQVLNLANFIDFFKSKYFKYLEFLIRNGNFEWFDGSVIRLLLTLSKPSIFFQMILKNFSMYRIFKNQQSFYFKNK